MTAPIIGSMAPVKLNSTVLAATDLALPASVAQESLHHSGNLFPSIVAVSGALPRCTFKTPLKDALSLIGSTALALTGFEVWLALFSASTYQRLGSASTKWATSAGIAYITGFSVSHGGIAMADVEVIPFSADGAAHPLTRTDSGSIPTLGSQPLLHTMGPLSINGTVITGFNRLSVQYNHTVTPLVTDGDLYCRTAGYIQGKPNLTGDHMDPSTLQTTLGWTGAAISANVIAYLKSYDATSQLVSVSNSISLTIASGRVTISDLNLQQGSLARSQLYVTPLSTSSTAPMAVSTAATAPST